MSGIDLSRIQAFSPARAIHCDMIAENLHAEKERHGGQRCRNFILSNDRGALIAASTFRLPLDRHVCAEVLWRFFGDMGEVDSDAEFTEKLLASQCRGIESYQELFFLKLEEKTHILLRSPSYLKSQEFGELYAIHLYINSKKQTLGFTHVLFQLYALLSEQHPTRPDELDDEMPWDQEIRYKKNCKWIERLNEHYDEAKDNTDTGNQSFDQGQLADAAWYYLRALFDLCPWFPSEWYMTIDEAAAMSQTIWHCLCRLAYYAWTLSTEKTDILARHVARIVFCNPFISREHEVYSARLMSRIGRDLEAKSTDRQDSYWSIIDSESDVDFDQAVCIEPRYFDVYFTPFDVVRWASERYAAGTRSTVFNFELMTARDIEVDAMDAWRKAYGDDKIPFTWDGTEDEALKEELGQPPSEEHLPMSLKLPLIQARHDRSLAKFYSIQMLASRWSAVSSG